MFITCSTTGWEPCEEADRLITVMEPCSRMGLICLEVMRLEAHWRWRYLTSVAIESSVGEGGD